MKVKYIKLESASKDVFKTVLAKKEGEEDYSSFIESLKKIDPNDINVMSEIKKTLKELTKDKDIEAEIIKRLEAK